MKQFILFGIIFLCIAFASCLIGYQLHGAILQSKETFVDAQIARMATMQCTDVLSQYHLDNITYLNVSGFNLTK